MIKAQIAIVPIGDLSIQGIMLPGGSYAVALPQLRELAFPSTTQNNALRELKAACGKDFQLLKASTEISNNPQWVISLDQLNFCLTELAFRGHKEARDLVRVLSGLSLHQLFCDAFGQKFEAEDRQRWLQTRFNTKHDFRPLTDQLQRYGFKEPWEYAKFISAMQSKIGLVNGTRDFADFTTLNKLERAQTRLTAYMECGLEPWNALGKIS